MKRLLLITLLISLPTCYFISCKEDKGQPPIIPQYETMVIDFSNFTTLKKASNQVPFQKGANNDTWEFAASVSGVWSSLIALNLEIPLASFESAADYDAAYLSKNYWQWSYNFSVDGTTYKARLTGQTSTSQVIWEMYITKDISGGFTDFLWFEGTSNTDGSEGEWVFKQSPQSPEPMFQTDWTKSGDKVTSVKYTYILESDPYEESFITYSLLSTGTFDSGFKIHFSNGLYSDSEIEWNSTTINGRLKCVDYLQDENWYCWDTNKTNKVCD